MSSDDFLDGNHPEWRRVQFSVPGDSKAGSADLHHQIHKRIDVPMYLQETLRSKGMISTLGGHGRRHVTVTMIVQVVAHGPDRPVARMDSRCKYRGGEQDWPLPHHGHHGLHPYII